MSDDSHTTQSFVFPETALDVYVFTPSGMPRIVSFPTNSVLCSALESWILAHRDGWKSSLNTYAPRCVVKGNGFTLNVRSDAIVLNYEVHAGEWTQIIHDADINMENAVRECLQPSSVPGSAKVHVSRSDSVEEK